MTSLPTEAMSLLGGLSYQEFLASYWQKKSLIVRRAFEQFPVLLTPEELAGLACDTEAPSRIVIEDGDEPWQSLFGPFDDAVFANLPETHWTLLVNDLERYFPELRTIIDQFSFIPNWRIDDLMISYAVEGGSVGPHRDEYDVFLIQLAGQRKWQIIEGQAYSEETLEGCSLSILKNFKSTDSMLVSPGDMLYLPPNMPHYGISQDNECLTLSVGFRAPSQQELINGWLEFISEKPEFKIRFSDKQRKLQDNSAEISKQDVATLSEMILSGINSHKDQIPVWLGQFLTQTKGDIPDLYLEDTSDGSESDSYIRKSGIRMAFIRGKNEIHLFVDGSRFTLPNSAIEYVCYLCNNHIYSKQTIDIFIETTPEFADIFNDLIGSDIIVS